jgi:hypothetical protein
MQEPRAEVPNAEQLTRHFECQTRIHDILTSEGWEVSWAPESSRFDLDANKGPERLLVELAGTEGLTEDDIQATIVGVRLFSDAHPEGLAPRAAIVLPIGAADAIVDPADAKALGVDIYVATDKGFTPRLGEEVAPAVA